MHYVMLVLTLYAPGCGPVERQIKFPISKHATPVRARSITGSPWAARSR
jgi:hypothetical protein